MRKTDSIGLYFKLINHKIIARVDTCLKEFDLTFSQMELLHFLKSRGGVLPQKAIEEEYLLRHTSVIGILQRMSKKGFLTVSTDSKDRRRRIVTLTEKTNGFFENAEIMREEIESMLTDGLSSDEKENLLDLLEKLYQNILTREEKVYDKKSDEINT